jgi:tetratricopeptide (TPR) repeat protein
MKPQQQKPPAPVAKNLRLAVLFLFLLTALLYAPVRHHEFVTFDDDDYVTENGRVRSGLSADNIHWAFTQSHASNWHPLTWISHMVDCQLWGLDAGGHHVTNALLHCLNSVLLFLLLHSMAGRYWLSAIVAGLFALHPLHVESVAWVSERKDVLSTFFALLTLLAYARYVKESNVKSSKTKSFYILALALFACGLMSKPMLVTLPFALLLLDYWPLARFSNYPSFRLMREKLPFLALTILSCVVTFVVQRNSGATLSLQWIPIPERLANASMSYIGYLSKTFWPADLAVFYPFPGSIVAGRVILSVVLLLFITALAVAGRKSHPWLPVGWFWFLGTLVPVIGIVQVGGQAMADRYSYIPHIGLLVALVWGVADFLSKIRLPRVVLIGATSCILLALTATTFVQLRHWRNSIALFNHAIAVTGGSAPAHHGLGLAYWKLGKVVEAEHHYREALRFNPIFVEAHSNLGFLLYNKNQINEAISQYQEALKVQPTSPDVRNNLGLALMAAGRREEAIALFEQILQSHPDFSKAHNNMGIARLNEGNVNDAIAHYRAALRIAPDSPDVLYNLATALASQQKYDEALIHFQAAMRLSPNDHTLLYSLGNVLAGQGRLNDAVQIYSEFLQLSPNHAAAHFKLGSVLAQLGRRDEAIRHLTQALRLKPDYEAARQQLQALGVTLTQ